MAEVNLSFLSTKDKQSLLPEVMGAYAAVAIIKVEHPEFSSFKDVDINYVHVLSPYLSEIVDNFVDFYDAETRLMQLAVNLSKSLELYTNGLSRSIEETIN
ncbi:hypothetical protein [Lacticaseibacillus paracasei]|uniref:hypothetical protein n=1 Tax=Lacticaseibacillus paracasei TaxID=1597 RepID=UPI00192B21E8|nr:hypothetical protein [Lacticaseibacillus paracasei]CAD7483785.1 hypothetical protein LPIBR_40011 [Lacticaseibacillus paracasei]